MNYPGNPALAPEEQERLLTMFQQAIDLAETGKRQESLLGCDFILTKDPQFALAKTLRERLGAVAGPIGVDDLRMALEPIPDWGTSDRLLGDDDAVDAGSIGLEMPPLDDAFAGLPPLETSFSSLGESPSRAPSGLRAELEGLLARREIQPLLELAGRNQLAVMADSGLQTLVQQAQSLAEAEPFVRQFLAVAEAAAARGDAAEVARVADKIAALDPAHPALATLRQQPAAAPASEVELEAPDFAELPSFDLAGIEPLESPVELFSGSPEPAPSPPSLLGTQPISPALVEAHGDPRIRDLLAEGQAAFDRADYQGAIDAWSRIFLIDIDSEEASDRIEQARRMKAELERKVEEAFQVAVGHLEKGAMSEAEQAFRRVLELQPGHLAAKDYVAQIQAGIKPAAPKRSESSPSLAAASGDLLAGGVDDLKEEILVPPEPGQERKRAAAAAGPILVAKGGRTARRNLILAGFLGVAALGGGGWYVVTHRQQLFPNADDAPVQTPGTDPSDPLVRAKKLYDEGKAAVALAQLKRMPPEAPQYAEAQTLIAAWEAALAPPAPVGEESEESRRLRQALELARTAHAAGDYLRARDMFEKLAAIAPLGEADAQALAETMQLLAPFDGELRLIAQGETERALPSLWRRLDDVPSDRVARLLVVTCYYNLGISDLQRGDPKGAAEKLGEAYGLAPDDEVLGRHLRFAQTYAERGQDLLYRTYVKYLAAR